MNDRNILMGLGGVAVVLFLVALFYDRSDTAQMETPAVASAEANAEMTALSARIAELEAQLADLAASTVGVEELKTQITTVQSNVAAVQDEVSQVANVSDALAGQMEDLKTRAATMAEAAVDNADIQTGASEQASQVTEEQPQQAASAAAGTEPLMSRGVGETAVFADGALRVFVSRLDPDAGEVRLTLNGVTETRGVGPGPIMAVGDTHCQVTVNSVADSGADIDALCGDDLPPPEGLTVGNTAVFSEGALRVFASRVDADGARVAINGDLQTLAVGSSAIADIPDARCAVTLDAVDRGHIKLSTSCGAPAVLSDPVSPGATAVMGDGAVRVFVAAVDDATNQARFAVNGLDVISGAAGDVVELDDTCSVQVSDVDDGKVIFAYGCSG